MNKEEVISWFEKDKGREPTKVELKHIEHYLKEGDLKALESFCGFPNSDDQKEEESRLTSNSS